MRADWIAFVFGALGAFLLASAVHPGWGFGAFLLSNAGWLSFALRRQLRALFWQQIVFTITSLIGLWNWWLGPLLLG